MCLCSPERQDSAVFKAKYYESLDSELQRKEFISALGKVVKKCANSFTVSVQPICIDGILVYAIAQYGSDEVVIVRDDDYPDLELPEWCANELLPITFRKAIVLSEGIHARIIKEYNIDECESKNHKRYSPKLLPRYAYLKSIGAPIPIRDIIGLKISQIHESLTYQILQKILLSALLFAVGGALLAAYMDYKNPDFRSHICGGALLGVAYALLALLQNYIDYRKMKALRKKHPEAAD